MFASYLKIVCLILHEFRILKEHLFINFADYLGVFGLNLGGFVDSQLADFIIFIIVIRLHFDQLAQMVQLLPMILSLDRAGVCNKRRSDI